MYVWIGITQTKKNAIMGVGLVSWVIVVVSFLQLAEADPPYTMRSCKDFKCGNINITYPFGMNKDCYKDPNFEVWCNKSTNPPTPIIKTIKMELISISTPNYISTPNIAIVKGPVRSINCSGLGNDQQTPLINLTATPFYLSQANTFNVIGCNTRGTINTPHFIGCDTQCPGGQGGFDWRTTFGEFVKNDGFRSCNESTSCCQTSLADQHIDVFDPSFQAKDGKNEDTGGCRMAFLSVASQWDPRVEYDQIPMGLSWKVDYNEWQPNSTTTFCSIFSDEDPPLSYYYTDCYCKDGYEGNPYLECTDIDECLDPSLSSCSGLTKCVNKRGSYKCEVDSKWIILIVIGVVLGVSELVVVMRWVYKRVMSRRKSELRKKNFKRNGGLLLQEQLFSGNEGLGNTKIFSLQELENATEGFSESRILGQGGQGTVFKGMLVDGSIIAVKKSKLTDEKKLQSIDEKKVREFVNEVVIISQINHRNVVKLLGCCLEYEIPLLVYEFIPNGSLFDHLHDQNNDVPFTWEMRLRIASEAAGALAYMHSAASTPIYHRDVKSSNILLDEKYRAKISDFGTSRFIPIDQTHLTTRVLGTFGYFDPEYYRSSQFTDKSDVYSFAVVLVELLSGKRPIFSSDSQSKEMTSLVAYFNELMEYMRVFDIVDKCIMESCCEKEEIIAVANLAKICLNFDGKKRPTMKEVATELERIRSSRSDHQLNVAGKNEEVYCEISAEWDSDISTSDFNGDKTLSIEVDL